MIIRTLKITAGLVSLVVLAAAIGLWSSHRAINRLAPPLPQLAEVLSFDPEADLPVSLSWINTASQSVPRSGVLEPSLDPNPDAPYVMSLPSFVLRWSDGRLFVIDAGMEPDAALEFGALSERLAGAGPVIAHGGTQAQLGASVSSARGIAFTHLHTDHVQGLTALCQSNPGLVLVQSSLQAREHNYTTTAGAEILAESGCSESLSLSAQALAPVPGFPGLAVLNAAGHTPGSQILVAHVRSTEGVTTWIFVGDVANHIEGIDLNLPKPHLYSLLLVPEATSRLSTLRVYLRNLREHGGARLLVSHDQLQLESSGLPLWDDVRTP